jgi:hypothetical protein
MLHRIFRGIRYDDGARSMPVSTIKLRSLLVLSLLGVAWVPVSQARGANAYTSLAIEVSTDNVHWSRSIQVLPGAQINARVVAGYEGRASLFGLAWVNFQPVVTNWDGPADQILPFVAAGSQSTGQVAYDKPQANQAGYGRIAPFAAISLGLSTGGFDTTLVAHTQFSGVTRITRIAQARTTNNIGDGPTTGSFAFNNTNGAGGIICAQTPSESLPDAVRSAATTGIVLFKFGIIPDASLSFRDLQIELPVGGVSKFGTAAACAGWFTSAAQTAAGVSYVPVITRPATISVRSVPGAPGFAVVAAFACLVPRRRRG